MNQGQYEGLLQELQMIRALLTAVLVGQRPAELLAFEETPPATPPEPIPADDLPAHPSDGSTTARRKFKKAKGGG